jgi:hypothetical protein
MEHSSSWEAYRFSASQEIPRSLWNLYVHYYIHKFPPPVPTLSQLDSVHTPHPTSWRSILILSSHLRLGPPSELFSSGIHFKTLYTPLLSPTCYMPRPSHSSRFYHPNKIGWGAEIIKLFSIQFPPFPCYLVPLTPKYSPQHPIFKHHQPTFLPQCERPSFTPTQNQRQRYSSVYLTLYYQIAKWNTKYSAPSDSKYLPYICSILVSIVTAVNELQRRQRVKMSKNTISRAHTWVFSWTSASHCRNLILFCAYCFSAASSKRIWV